MKRTIIAFTKNEGQAQQVVDQLRSANFSIQNISVLLTNHKGKTPSSGPSPKTHPGTSWTPKGEVLEEEASSQYSSGNRPSGAVQLGGSLGRLSNISAISVAGGGSFIAAGPLKNSFSGSSPNLAAMFINLGVSESEAKRFEEKLKKGHVLISFHTEETQELDRAKDIFKRAGAEDIALTGEAKAPKKARV